MKHNALALCFMGLMGFAGAASATLTAGSSSPSPGATGQSTLITYETRAGIGAVGFGISITDPDDVIVDGSVQFQLFDRDAAGGAGAFVNCDGSNLSTAAGTNIACSQSGQSATFAVSRTSATDVPTLSNNMRVIYSISGSATNGQAATFAFGPYCTGVQTPAANGCVAFNRTSDTQREDAPATPVANDGTVTVTVSANRAITSYAPNFGTTITFAAGTTPGTAAPTQNIAVTASGNVGTATLSGCSTAAPFSVTPAMLTFSDGDPTSPKNLTVGCTYPTTSATGTLTCTQTDQGGTPTQRTWNLSCPAPNATPAIAESPASGTPIQVGAAGLGAQGIAVINLTATGGSGTGSATVNCSSTGVVQLGLGAATPSGQTANQTVTGGAAAQSVRIGVTLTASGQPAAGTVTCVVTDAAGPRTLTYAISAGVGILAPEFIPASSLWSQLALIALFLGLGGLVLVVRRNG